MESLELFFDWIISSFGSIFSSISTWGIIGFGLLMLPVIRKLCNMLKSFFSF